MAARSELSIHHIIALLLRSVLKRLPDCTGVQKLKIFCTVWGSLTIVSASAKKIEQLLAFCLPENRAVLNCPERHFSAGFLTLGAIEGYNKEKLRGANRVY